MAAKTAYSTATRREYIDSRRSRFKELEYSYRDIAREVGKHWTRKPPAANTIMSDLRFLDAKFSPKVGEEDKVLLEPDNFREWRARHFLAPNGKPYLTTEYHMALFHIIAALALKTEVPAWVLEFWGLDDSVNTDIEARNVLFTVILLVAPRHGKSDLVQHAIIWLICENPNIRIIYCQGILTTSQEAMEWIKLELETNEKLIEAYGPFKNDTVRWNATGFTVATRDMSLRSPTLRPVGISSNIRSQDADIIIVDDPQDIRRAGSEATLNGDYNWFTVELMTRREPHTPVFGVGSHVASPYGDLWSQIEDSKEHLETDGQKIHIQKLPAHMDDECEGEPHDNCVVWPELRPYGFLMAQRALLGEQMYDAVYQQNPRPDGLRVFEKEVLTSYYAPPVDRERDGSWAIPPLPEEQEVYGVLDLERSWKDDDIVCCGPLVFAGGFDPAAGESKGASESAFMYKAACTKCQRRFYIDWWAKQQSPERNPDTILSFARSYPRLQSVRIEINAYQKSLARDPRLKKGARELRFLIEEWRTDDRKNDPSMGVPNLARWMRDGVVSIPASSPADRDLATQLTAYYVRYPRSPNDIVMADWLCDSELDKLITAKTQLISDKAPGWEDMPEYLREQSSGMSVDLGAVGWE